jgi:hypothetical protein
VHCLLFLRPQSFDLTIATNKSSQQKKNQTYSLSLSLSRCAALPLLPYFFPRLRHQNLAALALARSLARLLARWRFLLPYPKCLRACSVVCLWVCQVVVPSLFCRSHFSRLSLSFKLLRRFLLFFPLNFVCCCYVLTLCYP